MTLENKLLETSDKLKSLTKEQTDYLTGLHQKCWNKHDFTINRYFHFKWNVYHLKDKGYNTSKFEHDIDNYELGIINCHRHKFVEEDILK